MEVRPSVAPTFQDAKRRHPGSGQRPASFDPSKHHRGEGGRFTNSSGRIAQAVNLAGQNTTLHAEFSAVVRPGAIQNITGVDVRGFRHSVSNQAIAYAIKNHGNPAIEKARGQIAVTHDDFLKLLQIVKTGIVHPPEPHKGYLPRFVITAEIDGIGYHYVSEVRAGKRRLDMVTLRKKKGSW